MQRQRREEERISSAAMNAAVSQAEALGMTPVSVVRGAGMRLGGRHQATEQQRSELALKGYLLKLHTVRTLCPGPAMQ